MIIGSPRVGVVAGPPQGWADHRGCGGQKFVIALYAQTRFKKRHHTLHVVVGPLHLVGVSLKKFLG